MGAAHPWRGWTVVHSETKVGAPVDSFLIISGEFRPSGTPAFFLYIIRILLQIRRINNKFNTPPCLTIDNWNLLGYIEPVWEKLRRFFQTVFLYYLNWKETVNSIIQPPHFPDL